MRFSNSLPPLARLCYGLTVRRAAPLAFSLFLSACPEPPPRVGTTLDLTVPSTGPSPRIPLAPLSLRTQADFDALEDRFLGRRDTAPLLAALERLAAAAKPDERPEDALLLMRLGVLYRDEDQDARDSGGTGYLQKALAVGTRLRAEAPASPHTLYLQGYIPFAFLGGSADRAMIVTADTREFASACRDQWRALLAAVPDYDGPRALDHDRLAAVADALDIALAQHALPLPTATEPAPATTATRAEVEAMNQLARFETSTDGDRKTQCRDWDAGRAAAKPDVVRSRLELELDLACTTFLGKPDVAVSLIVRLQDLEGPAFEPCLALVRLRDRSEPTRLEEALRGTDLGCK